MIYVYTCVECGVVFEESHPMRDVPQIAVCPRCGSAAEKRITAPAVIFKGTGWSKGGDPTMDEQMAMPRPWEFDDLLPEGG